MGGEEEVEQGRRPHAVEGAAEEVVEVVAWENSLKAEVVGDKKVLAHPK